MVPLRLMSGWENCTSLKETPINDEDEVVLRQCKGEAELVPCVEALGKVRRHRKMPFPCSAEQCITWCDTGLIVGPHD